MPINYDEIIKKAEARRAALAAFAAAALDFEKKLNALGDAFVSAATLKACKEALDPEAIQLLGSLEVHRTVGYAEKMAGLHRALDQVPYCYEKMTYRQCIEALLDKVK